MFGILLQSDDARLIITITPSVISPEHVIITASMNGVVVLSNPVPHDAIALVMGADNAKE